jgi:hypothetical protein
MAKRRSEAPDGLERVFELLAEAQPGLHDIEPPSPSLPTAMACGSTSTPSSCAARTR